MLLRHCQAAQRCPSVYIWGEELEESGSEESSVVVKCLLKTLTRSGGCAHTFTGDYTGCVPQWIARVQHVFCVQEINIIKKERKYTLCCFFPSGPSGLKGQKGIMGRYGKVGPSGIKGRSQMQKSTSQMALSHMQTVAVFFFLLYIPRVEGRHRGSRSKGSKWRSRL